MTLYRPNGNFGPVCDPFDEVTDESLPIIFDASVLVNLNLVTVDPDGQNVASPVVSFPPDYRPKVRWVLFVTLPLQAIIALAIQIPVL